MHILILTIGTRGDVQPYVALGRGLIDAGHRVTLCASARFDSFVRVNGLEYAHMNDDMLEFMETEDGRIAMENTGNLYEFVRTAIRLMPKMGGMMRRQIEDLWTSTEQTNPDLILFHPKAIGAKQFAEKLGIPCALAFYLPMYVATGEAPAMGFPSLPLGKWYNRLTYRLIDSATSMATRKYASPWLKERDFAMPGGCFLQRADGSTIPAMHAFSPSVIPAPRDWPGNAIVTGYWFLDQASNWTPPESLLEFLRAGAPPVYVGFGSIFGRDPARTTRIVVEALRKLRVRAILATGWGGLCVDGIDIPSAVHVIRSAPHDWLFPRVSAVVHHGGCGTTAAGLRAGRPTVICPFFGDQPFWGDRIYRLGVGPKPIRQKRLTVDGLASAIQQTMEDTEIQRNAEAIGQRIRSENGVQVAVSFLEDVMTQPPGSGA